LSYQGLLTVWLEQITCLVNGTPGAHPHADRKLCNTMYLSTLRFPACRSVLLNFSTSYFSYDTGFSVRYRMGDFGKPSYTLLTSSNIASLSHIA